jgi:hypothetical protein
MQHELFMFTYCVPVYHGTGSCGELKGISPHVPVLSDCISRVEYRASRRRAAQLKIQSEFECFSVKVQSATKGDVRCQA